MFRKLFFMLAAASLIGMTAGCSKSKAKDEVKVPVKVAIADLETWCSCWLTAAKSRRNTR